MAEQSSHVIKGGVQAVITEFCNFRFLSNATTEYYNCLGRKTINQNDYSIFNFNRPKSRKKKRFQIQLFGYYKLQLKDTHTVILTEQ